MPLSYPRLADFGRLAIALVGVTFSSIASADLPTDLAIETNKPVEAIYGDYGDGLSIARAIAAIRIAHGSDETDRCAAARDPFDVGHDACGPGRPSPLVLQLAG